MLNTVSRRSDAPQVGYHPQQSQMIAINQPMNGINGPSIIHGNQSMTPDNHSNSTALIITNQPSINDTSVFLVPQSVSCRAIRLTIYTDQINYLATMRLTSCTV